MGIFSGSKKTTNIRDQILYSKIVKLSYLQTIAVSRGLIDTKSELETDPVARHNVKSKSSSKVPDWGWVSPLTNAFGLFGKKKKSVSVFEESFGAEVKDQWLHPYFDRIRYTVGIKELVIARYKFHPRSELISVPFISPKEVIKVHIIVDEVIPQEFSDEQLWIDYYIKPEGLEKWVQVAPLNLPTRYSSTGDIIPKILNFNIPKPSVVAVEQKYNYTPGPASKFRFKAIFSRPDGGDFDFMTPSLKSYRLVMTTRD